MKVLSYVELARTVSQALVGLRLPLLRASYDATGDVLYVHFSEKPLAADDSEFVDEDTVVRYRGGEVVGVTILNASKRKTAKA